MIQFNILHLISIIMNRKMMNFRRLMVSLVGFMLTVSLMAQRGYGPGHFNADKPGMGSVGHAIPDLTAEQEQKIGELRMAHMKEMNNYRSELSIKQAELQKLQTADNVEMEKINAKIDEIGKLKTEMAKKRATHYQKVRALLTDEQRVFFDSRHGKPGPGMRMGRRGTHGPREGFGPYCPRYGMQ
jgi:Spy/CpxP family protein refolding chaperone